ncbi:MAG: hypothetical protein Q9P90_18450 [candidate division KSB1 bacterium]|nr:hypothetical protein [candidate division KSB1 bacterium]
MKVLRLRQIDKPYFSYEDIARVFNISRDSARVAASRYARSGILLRLKPDIYILKEKWPYLSTEQKLLLANLLQVPSYVSLTTALAYYEITTQIQQNFIESIAIKRTKEIAIEDTLFKYNKINPALYFGFVRLRGFFIAEPEKALLDALYFMSFGRYTLDISAIDLDKFDSQKLKNLAKKFPAGTQKLLINCYEHS